MVSLQELDSIFKHTPNEEKFIKRLLGGTFVSVIGLRHSGKTQWIMSLLYHLLNNAEETFDEFHLIVSNIKSKANEDSCGFLFDQKLKKGMKLIVYETFDLKVIDDLIEKSSDGKKRLIVSDDSTKYCDDLFFRTETMLTACTDCRHLNMSMIMIFHTITSIFSVALRINTEYWFLFKIKSKKVLQEALFDEYLSMIFDDFEQFKYLFNLHMTRDYGALCVNVDEGEIDYIAHLWKSILNSRKHIGIKI
jgi:hypothetical protein